MSDGQQRSGSQRSDQDSLGGSDRSDDEVASNQGEEVGANGDEQGFGDAGEGQGQLTLAQVDEVNDKSFDLLTLEPARVNDVQSSWESFLNSQPTREAAGEAIYGAIFDAAPSLQNLFKSPRAVMSMRFMAGLNQIVRAMHDAKELKIIVETLGFQHLQLEVTVPRVVIFRDAICDLLQLELGERFTTQSRENWCCLLNYVGGAYIYIRTQYSDRLEILASSWATANNRMQDLLDPAAVSGEDPSGSGSGEGNKQAKEGMQLDGGLASPNNESAKNTSRGSGGSMEDEGNKASLNTTVPKTYNDMFMFNAVVMGYGNQTWMSEVLASFDTIVTNAANSFRLQEECDVLSLRIAKFHSNINLAEYKAVMLASLRSLVPKDWNSAHEVAWSWLWENVERMLKALMGKPAVWEQALTRLYASLDEQAKGQIRTQIYATFFSRHPAGQDYFKQSTTRLHFIADRVLAMTLEIYQDPKKMAEDISALGLRHVGYGIPTELFSPFVTCCVHVLRRFTSTETMEEGFRWALGLVSRILTRVINEGSTIVMKAINANSGSQLRKAIGCAPRGQRAQWVLKVQVGTHSISPLLWAIETGGLDAAKAIIVDLLTIRADRDSYYYGVDHLFERHPDIIKRLCVDAPGLLQTFLDGLVWRSRTATSGQRRVNYFVKHLLVDRDGQFAKAIEWFTDHKDPGIICHPVMMLTMDIIWGRVAFRTFLFGKSWFLFTLIVFVASQSVLNQYNDGNHTEPQRIAIFACRCFIYTLSLGSWVLNHARHVRANAANKEFVKVLGLPVPAYLSKWQGQASLGLTICLALMLCTEPILHCMSHSDGDFRGSGLFTQTCPEAKTIRFVYSILSMVAMVLYYLLLIDLSVLSTRISAFVLVCFRVLSEVCLFMFGLTFFTMAFASAVSALKQDNNDFSNIPLSALNLLKISLGMYSGSSFMLMDKDPLLLGAVCIYLVVTLLCLINLLVAQLNCSYQATYQDMLGFARLNRGKITAEVMPAVPAKRWERFVQSLHLDQRIEFGEGDVGLAGGIQIVEPASLHPTTVESILRYGGSTSPAAQWPADNSRLEDEDRLKRTEKLIEKAVKRLSGRGGRKGGRTGSRTGTMTSGSTGSFQSGSSGSSNGSL